MDTFPREEVLDDEYLREMCNTIVTGEYVSENEQKRYSGVVLYFYSLKFVMQYMDTDTETVDSERKCSANNILIGWFRDIIMLGDAGLLEF